MKSIISQDFSAWGNSGLSNRILFMDNNCWNSCFPSTFIEATKNATILKIRGHQYQAFPPYQLE